MALEVRRRRIVPAGTPANAKGISIGSGSGSVQP